MMPSKCPCVGADAISNAMEGWKKGHSDVLESGHTLILGWSDKITRHALKIVLLFASRCVG